MQYFVQQLINGLTLGSIYGLIAIGYTMVYGIIGMINFAHGDIFMVGAFTALIVFLILGALFYSVPIVIALLIMMVVAMLLTSLYNWTIEKVAYRPLREKEAKSAMWLVFRAGETSAQERGFRELVETAVSPQDRAQAPAPDPATPARRKRSTGP